MVQLFGEVGLELECDEWVNRREKGILGFNVGH